MNTAAKISVTIFTLFVGSIFTSEYFSPANGESNGAPSGVAGDPKSSNTTCAKSGCHGGLPVNSATGWITSNIPPAGFVPNGTYTITATAQGTSCVKFGFEISPQSSTGTVLGTMATLDASTKLLGSNYITHTSSGISGSGSKTWTFTWTAPNVGNTGQVTFYGAFNLSNNSFTIAGDTIYTSSTTFLQDPSTITTDINELEIGDQIVVYPNPVEEYLNISLEQSNALLSIDLLDDSGKVVKSFENLKEGNPLFVGDLNPGNYMLLLKTKTGQRSKKIIKQ